MATDAALIVSALAVGIACTAGGNLADMGGDPPTRLGFLLHTLALISGLITLILIAPVVFA